MFTFAHCSMNSISSAVHVCACAYVHTYTHTHVHMLLSLLVFSISSQQLIELSNTNEETEFYDEKCKSKKSKKQACLHNIHVYLRKLTTRCKFSMLR